MLHRRLITDDQPRVLLDAPLKAGLSLSKGVGTYTYSRASTATVMGYSIAANSGDSQVLLSVGSGEPRFQGARYLGSGLWSDKFADGTPIPESTLLGYLSDGSRTNLCLYSEDFSNAAWTKINATVSANSTAAPDGNTTADTLTVSVATGAHYSSAASVSFTSGTTYTASVWLKQGAARYAQLFYPSTAFGGTDYANFDLQAGTVSASSGSAATITQYPGGWFRCTVTLAATSTISAYGIGIGIVTSGAAGRGQSYTGNGTDYCYAWGAQVEQASVASTYAATTSASVTRAIDADSYPITNAFNTRGAIYTEITATSWSNATGCAVGDGTRGLLLSSSNSGAQLYDGTNTANGPTGTPSGTVKIAATWGGAWMQVAVNGSLGTPTKFVGSLGLTALQLGAVFAAIKNTRVYDRTLTAHQLTNLTR